ncbi:MAG: class I mannose-6-phosphate isomerase [Defluviitaleaceae bacterium]|nr:class I mannose-6-phosphate isomerase [Defluviitaleaceae bacterium]
MYPLIFRPIIKEMIWGNESWEVSCRPQEMSVVENGEFAGRELADFYAENARFPLLVKIITARDALSVQVHPDDAYARAKGDRDTGKSELWYILEPPTDEHLIIGLKPGVTREILSRAYEENTVEDCLARVKVSRGDIVNIPAGLIHALTPGTVVAEIQQNSDITYRLYDFGRLGADGKPRELHVEDALNSIDYDNARGKKIEHFRTEKLEISAPISTSSNPETFAIYTCVDGGVTFEGANFAVPLDCPRSAFIPASLGEFTIRPIGETAILLKSEPT